MGRCWGGSRGQSRHASFVETRLGKLNSLLLWGPFYLAGLKSLFKFLKPFNLKSPGRCVAGFGFKLINKIRLCLVVLRFVIKKGGPDLGPLKSGGVGFLHSWIMLGF